MVKVASVSILLSPKFSANKNKQRTELESFLKRCLNLSVIESESHCKYLCYCVVRVQCLGPVLDETVDMTRGNVISQIGARDPATITYYHILQHHSCQTLFDQKYSCVKSMLCLVDKSFRVDPSSSKFVLIVPCCKVFGNFLSKYTAG